MAFGASETEGKLFLPELFNVANLDNLKESTFYKNCQYKNEDFWKGYVYIYICENVSNDIARMRLEFAIENQQLFKVIVSFKQESGAADGGLLLYSNVENMLSKNVTQKTKALDSRSHVFGDLLLEEHQSACKHGKCKVVYYYQKTPSFIMMSWLITKKTPKGLSVIEMGISNNDLARKLLDQAVEKSGFGL